MSHTMTTEEAIRILNPDCEDVWKAYDGKDMERCNEACRAAVKALECRMPKKPISIKNDEDVRIGAGTWKAGVTVYKCPCCNSFISRSSDFCNKCGQALDWSDSDE